MHLLMAFEYGPTGHRGRLPGGDCHYSVGNLYAKKRVNRVKEILDKVGIGGERLVMYNLSSGMGGRFAEIIREITEQVLELGPVPSELRQEGRQAIAEVTT